MWYFQIYTRPVSFRNTANSEAGETVGSLCCLLHVGFMLGILFNPEEGGDILFRNVG
jgi:hypothetical protein